MEVFLAVATVGFSPLPPLHAAAALSPIINSPAILRAPLPILAAAESLSSDFAPRRRRKEKRIKGRKRETLLAKGIAGAALVRIAYHSQTAAFIATVVAPILILAPVVAVEAVLLSGLMMVTGIASYWPANLLAMGMGSVGLAGCVNGVAMWWEKRRSAKPRKLPRDPLRDARGERKDDDDSGNLVAFTIGALTAAILGSLP